MLSHKAVLNYANFTASFCRDGRLFTMTPSSVWSDGGASASAELSDVEFRQSDSSSSLPKAKLKDKSNQHAAFSAILGDANPQHFLSCAQASKSIQRGCRAFLILVDKADTAGMTEPDVTNTAVESCASDEAADLQLQMDGLKQDFAEVFAVSSDLPPVRGVEHVILLLPDSQPFSVCTGWHLQSCRRFRGRSLTCCQSNSLNPLPAPTVHLFCLWRRRVGSSGLCWTTVLSSLQMICSGWLHVHKSSLLQHDKDKSVIMMLSMLMLCLL